MAKAQKQGGAARSDSSLQRPLQSDTATGSATRCVTASHGPQHMTALTPASCSHARTCGLHIWCWSRVVQEAIPSCWAVKEFHSCGACNTIPTLDIVG
eukprot:352817-Chlamydomonas_euryale.AAC.10